jgi:hypothetical protein
MWAVRAWVLWLVIGLLGLASMQQALAQQITPPFGLYWGETQKEIAKILTHTGATIVDRSVVQGREAWTIDGLIQPALKQTIVYFGTAKVLVEVELQYQRPEWDLVAYEQFFDSARQTLESRYGPATVLVKDKKPEGDVMQTVVGYQWQAQGSSIQLFFYSAERNSDVYRSVSLHYRAG